MDNRLTNQWEWRSPHLRNLTFGNTGREILINQLLKSGTRF